MKQVDTSSMIKTKIWVVILVLWLFWLSSYMYGNNISSISELDIIPRSTWWADENMRVYKPKPKSNTYTPQKPPTATKIKQDIAEKYLLENFSNEFKIDKIIKENKKMQYLYFDV